MKIFEINLESGEKFKKNIETDEIEDAESYAETYYSSEGYNVRNLNPYHIRIQLPQEVKEFIDSQLVLRTTKKLSTAGLPDLICWKKSKQEITELFFVEVKFNSDSLSMKQLAWFTEFKDLETRIFGVYSKDKVIFKPGNLAVNSDKMDKMTERINETPTKGQKTN